LFSANPIKYHTNVVMTACDFLEQVRLVLETNNGKQYRSRDIISWWFPGWIWSV